MPSSLENRPWTGVNSGILSECKGMEPIVAEGKAIAEAVQVFEKSLKEGQDSFVDVQLDASGKNIVVYVAGDDDPRLRIRDISLLRSLGFEYRYRKEHGFTHVAIPLIS